jgi:guanylate kinase
MSAAKLIVVSAPSGSGKTTIARSILHRHPEIVFSVSATTRPRRAHEADGRDYFFVEREEFERMIRAGELIEWETIYGDYYGSLKRQVDDAVTSGRSILFDIDVKGALAIKAKYPNDAVLIFVKPPSVDVLIERLRNRRTESTVAIDRRLERVPMEMSAAEQFDYVVVNDDLQTAIQEVDEIVMEALDGVQRPADREPK